MVRLFPSAEGTRLPAMRATWCGDPHQRLSALCPSEVAHSPNATGRILPRNGEAHPIEPQVRSTRVAPCPQPDNHETTESILAKRTQDEPETRSGERFGRTNPRSLRSTFSRWAGMIAADQPSGTTRGI